MKSRETLILKMFVITLVIAIAGINLISAYNWQCFVKGEKINFCGSVQDRVCNEDECRFCVNGYDAVNKCYHYGGWNICNTVSPTCVFSGGTGGGGGGVGDTQAPTITLSNPKNGTMYKERVIPFIITTSEISDIYYTDLINGRGRWVKICTNCKSSSSNRNFNDGINRINIRAKDKAGNTAFKEITFFVDSKKPKIHKIDPRQGFANGNFSVQYSETNLKKINLTYGNALKGFKKIELSGCQNGNKLWCMAKNVNLSVYNGQEITYYFTVEDKAGSIISSREAKLKVDTVAPKINSFSNVTSGNKLTFKFSITETNFDVISYTDNFNGKLITKTLCSTLKNGICEKSLTFSKGSHSVVFKVLDEAGNSVTKSISFTI